MWKNFVLFAGLCVLAGGFAAYAMENGDVRLGADARVEQSRIMEIEQNLKTAVYLLQRELLGGEHTQDNVIATNFQKCRQEVAGLQQFFDEEAEPKSASLDVKNICHELSKIFDLIQIKLHILEQQIFQTPDYLDLNSITQSSRTLHLVQLVQEGQKIQNNLHTLSNILNNQQYRLVPGETEEEGNNIVVKQILKELPVAFFQSNTIQQLRSLALPSFNLSSLHQINEQVAGIFDNIYSNGMINHATLKINAAEKLIRDIAVEQTKKDNEGIKNNALTHQLQPMQLEIDRCIRWLTFDVGLRLRSSGSGRFNNVLLLINEGAKKVGVQQGGEKALKVFAEGGLKAKLLGLLRYKSLYSPALAIGRKFESMVVAAAQPKPQTWLSTLKWWAAKGCSGLLRLFAGGDNLQKVQKFMVGNFQHAPRHENAVIINFDARYDAPEFNIYNHGTLYKVHVDGTDSSSIITVKQDEYKSVWQVQQNEGIVQQLNQQSKRKLALYCVKDGNTTALLLSPGDTSPLIHIVHEPESPRIKIIGAPGRQIQICQKRSIATPVTEMRKIPVIGSRFDTLVSHIGAQTALFRSAARTLYPCVRSLAERRHTDVENNVKDRVMWHAIHAIVRV